MAFKKYYKQSPNYTAGSQSTRVYGIPRTYETIAIHWWGDPNLKPTLPGVVGFLTTAGKGASSHYVASGTDRQVAQLVREEDIAWATNAHNPKTIAIECDPRARAMDYDVVAELIADIWKRRGKLALTPHYKWANTECSGVWDLPKLYKLAETKVKGTVAKTEVKVAYTKLQDKQMEFVRAAPLWNFDFAKHADMKKVKTFKKGDIIKISGIAKHPTGSKYGMTAYSFGTANMGGKPKATNGVNLADLKDYIAPKPTSIQPAVPKPKADDPTQESVTGGDRSAIAEINKEIETLKDKTEANEKLAQENRSLIEKIVDFFSNLFK